MKDFTSRLANRRSFTSVGARVAADNALDSSYRQHLHGVTHAAAAQRAKSQRPQATVAAPAAAGRRVLQDDSNTVDYTVTSEEDVSGSLPSTEEMANAINEAGDALDEIAADELTAEVESVSTEFEFEVDASGGTTETMPEVSVEGATVEESTVLPADTCTTGLEIAHSDRTITNRCEGQAGAVCEYTCDDGYFSTGTHACAEDGSFSGGECLADGTVICPAAWQDLTEACDSLALATDAGMATRTVTDAIIMAQEKWSQCAVAECGAPTGADETLVGTCDGVSFAEGDEANWETSCTDLGCEYTGPLTIASATCDGEPCSGELEIGSTDVECVAFFACLLVCCRID